MLKLYTSIFYQCLIWFMTVRTKGLPITPKAIADGKNGSPAPIS